MAEIKRIYTAVFKTPSQAMIYALTHTVIHGYPVTLLYAEYYLFEMCYIFVLPGWLTS